MSAKTVEIIEDVVGALQGAALSETVTVARSYVPDYELSELSEPVLTVAPRARRDDLRQTRGLFEHRLDVDIAVQCLLPADTNAQQARRRRRMDELIELAETVIATLREREPFANSKASFQVATVEPLYDPTSVHEKNLFVSVITATYLVIEEG